MLFDILYSTKAKNICHINEEYALLKSSGDIETAMYVRLNFNTATCTSLAGEKNNFSDVENTFKKHEISIDSIIKNQEDTTSLKKPQDIAFITDICKRSHFLKHLI